MAKTNERDRYDYGVCINRDKDGKPCPKCESKEVQKIRKGQDFICEDCKESLRKVPPPKPKTPLGMIAGIIVAAIIVIGLAAYMLFFKGCNDETSVPPVEQEPVIETTQQPEEQSAPVEEKTGDTQPVTIPTGDSNKTYSFGRYEGKRVNGIPDGQGTMYYTCRVQIAKHGRNTYYAEKGDTFVGTWGNGDIVNGKLLDSNNNQKAAILAGKRPNPYDLTKDKCE